MAETLEHTALQPAQKGSVVTATGELEAPLFTGHVIEPKSNPSPNSPESSPLATVEYSPTEPPDSEGGYGYELDDDSHNYGLNPDKYGVLDRGPAGELVAYNRETGNYEYFDPHTRTRTVIDEGSSPQFDRTTYESPAVVSHEHELPDHIALIIHRAGSFDKAIARAIHEQEHVDPRVIVAALTEITAVYSSEVDQDEIDQLTLDAIENAKQHALSDEAAETNRSVDSMISALPLLSSEKVDQIIPVVKDTVDKLHNEAHGTGAKTVDSPRSGGLDVIHIDAARNTLQMLTDPRVDIHTIDAQKVLAQEIDRTTLEAQRKRLLGQIEAMRAQVKVINNTVETIEETIEKTVVKAPRRRVVARAVLNMLRFPH